MTDDLIEAMARSMCESVNGEKCPERKCRERACLEPARAALAVVREREGWRPIETAPKDGTMILAAFNWKPYASTLFWASYASEWRCPASERGPLPEGWQPTHWRPLPPPPEAE